jgi:hypothetical protein
MLEHSFFAKLAVKYPLIFSFVFTLMIAIVQVLINVAYENYPRAMIFSHLTNIVTDIVNPIISIMLLLAIIELKRTVL